MLRYLWLSVLVLLADQLSKQLAEARLAAGQVVELTGWFNLRLAYNRGAAFSFLGEAGGWQRWLFIGVGLLAVGAILLWLHGLRAGDRLLAWALALILGGALGNLVDRVLYGHVVDFIDWHYAGWHWPAFNLADAAISLGVVLLLGSGLLSGRAEQQR
ncbi:signal peptidase II [Thiohalobacter sp. IOR34]|uniref:signal peptidase II n=1 Tax=Thiohalobacter sp. IOR34 TaxID=3057176 RepID=UPI0025B1AF32|nr:signal peptidase II [Thiohalobacter sp. IOR34]WJW75098.1 signal peptidase II [Thiohalobacter sp. IOR34]